MRVWRSSLFPGLLLILLGLYFLSNQLNVRLPGLGQLWPALPVLAGPALLAEYAAGERRDPGQIFAGVVALLAGGLFFLFTLHLALPLPGLEDGVSWGDMGRLWSVWILIVGLAFLAQ